MNNETNNSATPESTSSEEIRKDSEPSGPPNEPPAPDTEMASQPALARTGWTEWVRQGLRASALRPLRTLPDGPSAWQMLCIVGITLAIDIGLARFEIDGAAQFSPRTWLFGWASTGLMICGVWIIFSLRSKMAVHSSPVAAWFLLSSVALVPINLIGEALYVVTARNELPRWWIHGAGFAWITYVGYCAWFAGATWRTAKAVNRSTWAAVGLVLFALVVMFLNSTLLRTRDWEPVYREYNANDHKTLSLSQEVFETQQKLLSDALRAIRPHEGRQRQIYGLIYAPYSQDVFLRESAMVQEVLEQRFGAQSRVVRLVNHPTTATDIPWATNRNLERGLEAIAKAMDTESDVLVLYLTSHGGADFTLATHHWPLDVNTLTATQLRSTLDKLGIRNRVIAVSACYSGGWIEPLKSDNTLIMTAADRDHTSFGCGSRSTLTYFGRAVFDEQLRKSVSFEDAFNAAVPIIAQRESDAKKDDGFSNPQISVGKDIRLVLDEWAAQQTSPLLKRAAP
jgi:hypothetical protein